MIKGQCGICGINIYDTDKRMKREGETIYICEDCWSQYSETPCATCTDLFHCEFDHNYNVGCK